MLFLLLMKDSCVRKAGLGASEWSSKSGILVWGGGYTLVSICTEKMILSSETCEELLPASYPFSYYSVQVSHKKSCKVILTQADRTKHWWWSHFVPAQPSTITHHVPDYMWSESRETAAGHFQLSVKPHWRFLFVLSSNNYGMRFFSMWNI